MDYEQRQELVELLQNRIDQLKDNMGNVVENARPKRKELRKRQVKGRIKECRTLKAKLSEDKLDEYVQQ